MPDQAILPCLSSFYRFNRFRLVKPIKIIFPHPAMVRFTIPVPVSLVASQVVHPFEGLPYRVEITR